MARRNFKPQTLIRVHWLDIAEAWNDAPEAVTPARFTTIGYFLGWHEGEAGWFLRISNTTDQETDKPHGACAFPEGCVTKVEPIS